MVEATKGLFHKEMEVAYLDDKQKIDIIKDVAYLQQEVHQRFYNLITEQIARNGLCEEDILRFKDSVNYVMDERFKFVSSRLADMGEE